MITDDRRYWFRAKRYGWGWGLPVLWQGWAVLLGWLSILSLGVRYLAPSPMRWAFMAAMIGLLTAVFYWKGDPAGRRWNSGDGT